MQNLAAVAVTTGPGLAIALEVGIKKAVDVAREWKKPLIAVNHVEGHALSPLAEANFKPQAASHKPVFPCVALVASGKHCDIILVSEIGKYQILAHTIDDALGEALDKAARMLGFGYPGGAGL